MDRDNRRNEVLAVAFLFLVLSWATVCLRFYVRGIFKKTWGNDDSFMGATLVRSRSGNNRYAEHQLTVAVPLHSIYRFSNCRSYLWNRETSIGAVRCRCKDSTSGKSLYTMGPSNLTCFSSGIYASCFTYSPTALSSFPSVTSIYELLCNVGMYGAYIF
jgi:hypothetical protein